MSERIDTAALLARVDLVAVVGSYLPLKKVGGEFVANCPFHGDKTPSFTVIPAKQFCHCFGCGFSGDAIAFVQAIEDCDFKIACERLGANTWTALPIDTSRPKVPTKEWISGLPPAEDPKPAHFRHYKHGEPANVWTYLNADGAILGYVCRYDFGSNGSRGKTYQPFTYGQFEGEEADYWNSKTWTRGKRPLYGLDRLAARPGDPVILTEGEKACDAAAQLLPQYVPLTWPGGAQALRHADFGPLAGRRILLWPDAGTVGIECMEALARLLGDSRGLACDPVKLVDVSDWADGRDLADCVAENWTPNQVMEWAAPRVKVYVAPQQNPEADQVPEQATAGEGAPFPSPDLAEGPPPMEFPPEASAEKPKTGTEDELPVEMSEDALADAFAKRHGEDWRYVKVWHAWFEYVDHGWQEDKVGKLDRLAVELCRSASYWPAAGQLTPTAKRALGTRRLWWAVRDTASNHPSIRASVDQWDRHPLLLLTPGGVVDIRTGILGPGEHENYLTKRTSVTPAPGVPKLWLAHLRRMTGNDGDKVNFLHLYAGYCATGETREQCFAFLFGPGQNGKGVFVTTLARVLGDYAVFANSSTFMDAEGAERHLSELARLQGARLVVVDETDSSKRWNEARVKSITGGGRITANRMRQDPFDFDPQFKLLIAGNHRPQIRGVGKAMRRRVKLVECLTEIPETERDNYFDEKLREEYPQILNWIIEGARMWRESGLPAPESIELATERYIQSEDVIGEWLEDCCEQKDEMETGAGYKSYCAWTEGRNDRPWTRRAWNNAMSEKGYDIRKSNGLRFLIGVSLRAANTVDQERKYYSPD